MMANGKTDSSALTTMLTLILSKEGLVGMLLTVMIVSNLFDTYRSTTIQTELNHAINRRMIEQTEHEKIELEIAKDLIDAIERLELKR